jgi:hypothetical protein
MVGCDYDAFRLTGCCRSDRVANKHSGQLWPLRARTADAQDQLQHLLTAVKTRFSEANAAARPVFSMLGTFLTVSGSSGAAGARELLINQRSAIVGIALLVK